MSNSNPTDPKRPDLDESMNVAAAHDEIAREHATTVREKRVRENGMEPISLWVILVAGLIAMIGGSLVGMGPGVFSMGQLVREGYTTAPPPSGGAVEIPPMAAKDALIKRGAQVYNKCIGCHQGNGLGDGSNYPPLAGSEWVTGDNQQLAMIILHGLKGNISVNGQMWTGKQMPAQGAGMTAQDLAAVMTYVRNSWGNTADIVSPAQAQAALDLTRSASGQTTVEELKAEHAKTLEGEKLEPDTMVEYETLQPAG